MIRLVAMVAVGVVWLAVPGLGRDAMAGSSDTKSDGEVQRGSWVMVALKVNGEKVAPEQIKGAYLVVENDRYVSAFASEETPMTYAVALDPSKAPASIDLTLLDGPRKGAVLRGIYKVENDALTVCRGLSDHEPRPSRFDAPEGSAQVLTVWKRAAMPGVATGGARLHAEEARELETFQGTWRMTAAVSDGKEVPASQANKVTVTYHGAKHTVRIGDEVVAHDVAFTLDPSASPKAITDTILEGPQKGMVIRGIYRFDGEELISCVAPPGHERPTSFDAGPGTGRSLRVYRRVPPPDPAIEAEHARFEGAWAVVSMETDGQAVPADLFREMMLTLKGHDFTSKGGGASIRGTYVLDISKLPRTIDVTFRDGPEAGHTIRGLYERNGDTCRLCVASANKPRPDGFVSRPGSGVSIQVLKRRTP